jgi:hypothetical protein
MFQLSVAVPVADVGAAATDSEYAGSELIAVPSDTEIRMLATDPAWAVRGIPDTSPVWGLMLAHAGSPVALNVSVSPSASEADGWNA